MARAPLYHSPDFCNVNFQSFGSKLNGLLTNNPPEYDDALNLVSNCEELRTSHSQNIYGKRDQAHQNVSNLLNNLGDALEKLKPTEQPLQVVYKDNPMRFLLYSLSGHVVEITSAGDKLFKTRGGKVKKTQRKNRKHLKTHKRKRRL
jgi:hypothetical protein